METRHTPRRRRRRPERYHPQAVQTHPPFVSSFIVSFCYSCSSRVLGGVHHYDEYGLRNLLEEPPEIRKIHGEMITFVTEWLKGWEDYKKNITSTKVEGS